MKELLSDKVMELKSAQLSPSDAPESNALVEFTRSAVYSGQQSLVGLAQVADRLSGGKAAEKLQIMNTPVPAQSVYFPGGDLIGFALSFVAGIVQEGKWKGLNSSLNLIVARPFQPPRRPFNMPPTST